VLARIFEGDLPHIGSQRLDAPILVGMVIDRTDQESAAHVRERNPDGSWKLPSKRRFNSAVLAARDGSVRGIYDKRELLMFGEYLPAEPKFPWLRRLLPHAGAFSAGNSPRPLSLNGWGIATLICYEDILDDLVRDTVNAGDTDLLVDISSDAWFRRSEVPALHLALARLRSIEHRRFLVHATTTGVSAVVDPTGRIVALLPPNSPASGVASIRWMRGRTLYEDLGETPRWGTLGLVLLFVTISPRKLVTIGRATIAFGRGKAPHAKGHVNPESAENASL
jgi:apolipoprotein N-acyltransferase